ncbi:uncharacterized protein LOC110980008 isoform X2 [Acanthaster planci]|uniref:Uncharacterized protein LOC110980008 isoform X2 n=1 Tax=Acanthaster planci TaxID=133434 RepID=A0A8B7YH89_ACAPL|nr:uncharacterized protein LOC110980008 isoform X2 [Acanthaster planci]
MWCNGSHKYTVLKIEKDQEEIASAVNTRLRANNAPLPEYLFSRSIAGVTHADIIEGLEKASGGEVFSRFFHLYPKRVVNLPSWLTGWINQGAVPIATLNLQRVSDSNIPDAWHHQMVYGVTNEGVHMCNPLIVETIPNFIKYTNSDSVLLIRRVDVISRWQEGIDLSVLSQRDDPRWQNMDVEGQVKKMLSEPEPYSHSPESRPAGLLADWLFKSHISIPAAYQSGITLCVRKDNVSAYKLLTEEPELPEA